MSKRWSTESILYKYFWTRKKKLLWSVRVWNLQGDMKTLIAKNKRVTACNRDMKDITSLIVTDVGTSSCLVLGRVALMSILSLVDD